MMENRTNMTSKTHSTPARALLPSPIEKTPPTSTRKRILNELSINIPPRSHSAQSLSTPERSGSFKKSRKVSEPYGKSTQRTPVMALKRDSPTDEDKVWGPDVEAAFMSAIRLIPKLGRRKICIGSKPCGRNELIASFICRRTGKIRTRKQVSSHIQVLKHIRRDDAEFLALVADGKDDDEDVSPQFDQKDMDRLVQDDRLLGFSHGYHLGMTMEEEYSPLGKAQRLRNQSLEVARSRVRLDDFRIWATKNHRGVTESHIYTTAPKVVSYPIVHIDAIRDWPLRFPCLQDIVEDPVIAQVPILHLRASLNVPETLMADPLASCVLKSRLVLAGFEQTPQVQWFCALRVYTMGRQILELREPPYPQGDWTTPGGDPKLQICFASEFWAAFLGELSGPEPLVHGMTPEECRLKRERDTQTALGNITVVQEVFALEDNMDTLRRHAVLMWEFNKSHLEDEGQTTVSRVATAEQTPMSMVANTAPMARTMSQPQFLSTTQKSIRPNFGPNGASLQRSQSMAGAPKQSYYNALGQQSRSVSASSQFPGALQPSVSAAEVPPSPMYYSSNLEQADLLERDTLPESSFENVIPYNDMPQQQANTYAMARSFSAPTWAAGVAPTQYPSSMDTGAWNDNLMDWPMPESANYLHGDFQIQSDDYYTTVTTPSRSQSTAPQSFSHEQIDNATTTYEEVPDSRLPQLGFFPLANTF